MTRGAKEKSPSKKIRKPDIEIPRKEKSCSMNSNSTFFKPVTEASIGNSKRKKIDPITATKRMNNQCNHTTNLPPLTPPKPIRSLRKYPSLYEALKTTLTGKNGPDLNDSFHVYTIFLDILFDYPLKERHSKCINALKPVYNCCLEEGCPAIVFLNPPLKEKKFRSPKSRKTRKQIVNSLETKLKTLRNGLLQKLNLAAPEMPMSIIPETSESTQNSHPSHHWNTMTKSTQKSETHFAGIWEQSSMKELKEMEKVHKNDTQTSSDSPELRGCQKTKYSRKAYYWRHTKPEGLQLHVCDTFGFLGPSLSSAGNDSVVTGIKEQEGFLAQLESADAQNNEAAVQVLRTYSGFEPPPQTSLFVVSYDFDSTFGGPAIFFDSNDIAL